MNQRTFSIIFAIGVLLRVFYINVPPLWYDENFTLILARLPFNEMIQATMGDVHPPLWYIIEWTIFHIAPNAPAWIIRVPACVFSIAALLLFVRVMRALDINPKVQTTAFALMAVMPFQLWYAQEGRMYAMLEFFVLVTLAAALERKYLMLFIGSLALLYTQNYGPFYMAAIALVFFFRFNFMSYPRALAAMIGAGVLWLPWFFVVSQQMSDIEGRYWIMDKSLGAVLIILYKLFLTAAVPSELFFASYTVTFAALILGIIAIARSWHPARVTVALMAFVPLLIGWLVSLVWQPVLLFRPLIGVSPFLYLVVCWSLSWQYATEIE
jgi:uncharacterized membrane protein